MSQAVIISIGTEMLTGARINTNSAWLSDQLNILGIETRLHITVGDNLEEQVEIIRDVIPDCELILLTGGLGPTLDDLTREVLARVINVELFTHEPSLTAIREMFASRGRTMPDRNIIQAKFPVGSTPLPNPVGTAPGIYMEVPQSTNSSKVCRIAAMPGVPSEMKIMFQEQVIPRLPSTGQIIKLSTIECFGVGESHCEEMLGDITARGRDPEVGITVHQATISLRIVAKGKTAAICQEKIQSTKQQIYEKLDSLIFGEEGISLEEVVISQLKQQHLKLAICELGHTGGLSSLISKINTPQHPFLGGITAPLPDNFTGGQTEYRDLLEAFCKTNIDSCLQQYPADVIILTAIPTHPDKKYAMVGLYHKLDPQPSCIFQQAMLFADETLNQARTSKAALNLLRLQLLRK